MRLVPARRRTGDTAWGSYFVARGYARLNSHCDRGERAAFGAVAEGLRGDVLDLGVGAGRTTGLVAANARSYLGIDSSPHMIELAASRHPHADLRVGDARDLTFVPDASMDVVLFSYNGIDCVNHEDRDAVLREVHRVLRPSGHFVFSTHNLDGGSYGESPAVSTEPRPTGAKSLLAYAVRRARLPLAFWHFARTAAVAEHGDGWATWPLRVHSFRFVVHFATLGRHVRELGEAGLVPTAVWGNDGSSLTLDNEHAECGYFHFVCRRH